MPGLGTATWKFGGDELDSATEYFYIFSANATPATIDDYSNLTAVDSDWCLNTGNPYSGGIAWRANAYTTDWDLEFEVVSQIGGVSKPIGTIALGSTTGGDLTLGWDTVNGQTYNVETNANLILVSGWGIYDTIIGDGGSISITSTPTDAQLFYKVTSP